MIDFKLLKLYSNNVSILLVEDDKELLDATQNTLLSLTNDVEIALDGKDALYKYQHYYEQHDKFYDIVITDLDMPELDGISLIKKLYTLNKNQNVIVISAHNSRDNLLELLNMHITQFIVKPIEMNKFLESLFVIVESLYNESYIKIHDNLHWDNEKKTLYKNNQYHELTKKENLLINLLINSDTPLSADYLLDEIWNSDDYERVPNIANLKNLISRLRKKIPEVNIQNAYGHGYKLDTIRE